MLVVLGESALDAFVALKYNKCRHLDLTNLKKITAINVGIDRMPLWMKDCHNLKIL